MPFLHGLRFSVCKIESTLSVYSDMLFFGFALKKSFWRYVDVGRDANHKNPSSQHHPGHHFSRPSSTSSWCASKGVCTRPTNLNSINWTPVGGTFVLHWAFWELVWSLFRGVGGVCEPVPFRLMMYLAPLTSTLKGSFHSRVMQKRPES